MISAIIAALPQVEVSRDESGRVVLSGVLKTPKLARIYLRNAADIQFVD